MSTNLGQLRERLDDELYYGPTPCAKDLCAEVYAVLRDPDIRRTIGGLANVLDDRLNLLNAKIAR